MLPTCDRFAVMVGRRCFWSLHSGTLLALLMELVQMASFWQKQL